MKALEAATRANEAQGVLLEEQKKQLAKKLKKERDERKEAQFKRDPTHVQAEMDKPEVLADHKRLSEVGVKLGEAQRERDRLYARWAELEERV